MFTDNIPGNSKNKADAFQLPDGTPVSSFTTAWIRTHRGSFRVHQAIMGPVPEEPKNDLTLSRTQANHILKAIADKIMSLKKDLRG